MQNQTQYRIPTFLPVNSVLKIFTMNKLVNLLLNLRTAQTILLSELYVLEG